MSDLALSGLAAETVRLVTDVRRWSVERVRPLARIADELHDVPDEALAVLAECPISGAPVGGSIDYPRRGAPDFDASATDSRNILGLSLIEALSYGDVLAHTMTAAGEGLADIVVRELGTPEQVLSLMAPIHEGRANLLAFAMTEPECGSDPGSLRTTARSDGSDWIINGRKVFCSNGAVADRLLVFATTDRALGYKGIRALVVDREAPGVHIVKANEQKLGWRSMMTTELAFENVRVPHDAMLGGATNDRSALRDGLGALNFTRGYMGAMVIGIAQAAVDEGRRLLEPDLHNWSDARVALITQNLDRMDAALHRSRISTRRFARLVDAGRPYVVAGSMSKAIASPLAERVIVRVIQMLGSTGYSDSELLEKWHRDVKIFDIFEGTGNIQRITIGRALRAGARS